MIRGGRAVPPDDERRAAKRNPVAEALGRVAESGLSMALDCINAIEARRSEGERLREGNTKA